MNARWRNPPDHDTAPLPVLMFEEIQPQLAQNHIVKGLLGTAAMSVLYGDSNTGKTFAAVDLALHVALGRDWFDRKVKQGGVLYIAAEGGYGIQNRVVAVRLHYNIDGKVPFAVIPTAVDLCSDDADTNRLIAAILDVVSRMKCKITLVIVDTLSRALAGGNESGPEDMGSYVQNIDRIRQATGAHVLSVHHTGKDHAKGARGHSLLRAATDTEIELTRDQQAGISIVQVKKQRDLPSDVEPLCFRLKSIELGHDEDGEPVTSCVVVEAEKSVVKKAKPLTDDETLWYRELCELFAHDGMTQLISPISKMEPVRCATRQTVRDWCKTRGLIGVADTVAESAAAKALTSSDRTIFNRMLKKLKFKGKLSIHGDWIWLVHNE